MSEVVFEIPLDLILVVIQLYRPYDLFFYEIYRLVVLSETHTQVANYFGEYFRHLGRFLFSQLTQKTFHQFIVSLCKDLMCGF